MYLIFVFKISKDYYYIIKYRRCWPCHLGSWSFATPLRSYCIYWFNVFVIDAVHLLRKVITSKQRPRKLCIRGSNGKEFMFLLKGHEDLRQDERVMQLFGLVNTLLSTSHETLR